MYLYSYQFVQYFFILKDKNDIPFGATGCFQTTESARLRDKNIKNQLQAKSVNALFNFKHTWG